jgi:glutamate synthase (NADPH/NADH) small chain
MADRMQKYGSIGRATPEKRGAAERRTDQREIYRDFTPEAAARQASRCEQCGTPYCQIFCPLHNNIPDWLKLTAEGRLDEAYARAQETNNFPEICGRICPQDRLCEAKWACTLEQAGHGTVTIGAIERYITDNAWKEGWVRPRRPRRERAQRVAVLGAGPAGMAAAEELRALGYQVDLYDRHARMGGLMAYGIPGFKLEKHVVERRAALLRAAGVRFHPGITLGREVTLADLRAGHDAVVLAFGAYAAKALDVPGAGRAHAAAALDYLIGCSRHLLGEVAAPPIDAAGRRVVVIGGGDTAMDCVRTAVRQGAVSVTCLYRRDRANMPGSAREVGHAEEEGVAFAWRAQPEALLGVPVDVIPGEAQALEPAGGVAVHAVRTRLGQPGPDGRRVAEPVPGSAFVLDADLVINAIGFSVEDAAALSVGAVGMTGRATVAVDRRSMMTAADGVFAAGDAVRGPSLVVWAIRDGRDVAAQVHRYLSGRAAAAPRAALPVAAE